MSRQLPRGNLLSTVFDETSYTESRVWDLPTRLFHWMLVATVTVGWFLGDNMSFSSIQWHFYLGYATGGLIVFRLIWGIVGPPHARLSALFPKPSEVLGYVSGILERQPSGVAGHNPLGALAVLALLSTLCVQVVTGLFSESDDFFSEGPLSFLANNAVVRLCNLVHEISSTVLLVLVGLHISALLFYLVWKRENLIKPMITGLKTVRR